MIFEIEVPDARGTGYESKLQVQAASWRHAVTVALQQSGDTVALEGAFVHVGDDGMRVTDPVNRRVIRVRRLNEAELQSSQVIKALSGSFPLPQALQDAAKAASPADAPAPSRQTSTGGRPIGFTDKATGAFRAIGSADLSQHRSAEATADAVGRVLQEMHVPVPEPEPEPTEAAPQESPGPGTVIESLPERTTETALEDVFLEMPRIFEPDFQMEDAIDFVTDLAMRYVPSEHGALLFASDTADFLYFASARGPVTERLLDAELPIDHGVPAACLRSGIAIALADPNNDPRHTDDLTRLGVTERSIVVAPVQHGERAFGVLLLVNRQERAFFSPYDTNIVTYIAGQMGKFIQQQLDAMPLE